MRYQSYGTRAQIAATFIAAKIATGTGRGSAWLSLCGSRRRVVLNQGYPNKTRLC